MTSSMMDARSDALRKKFQKELMAQLDKKFPVWLGFDSESMARRNRFKETFSDIDDDQSVRTVLCCTRLAVITHDRGTAHPPLQLDFAGSKRSVFVCSFPSLN